MSKINNILFCVLDWGLGHASRSIPLIKKYIDEKKEAEKIVVASSGNALQFLMQELENETIVFEKLPSYNIQYSKNLPFEWMMLFQLPKIFKTISAENKATEKLVERHKITKIISDNRYGCHHKNAESSFLGHQLYLQLPKYLKLFEHYVWKRHFSLLSNFDQFLVPDFEESKLSGKLSSNHNFKLKNKVSFIGLLTRMKKLPDVKVEKNSVLFLLSGPEPQRSIFENLILNHSYEKKNCYLIRGTNNELKTKVPANFKVINMANAATVNQFILSAEKIVCRSGYSTLMDLTYLERKAILVATPRQTEQEYLAKRMADLFNYKVVAQDNFAEKIDGLLV